MTRVELLLLCPTHFPIPHNYIRPTQATQGWCSLRPIISMCGSLWSPISRLLADIMSTYMKGCDSEILNSTDLVNKLRAYGDCSGVYLSFDVESLFTNVPVNETLEIFSSLLVEDTNMNQRTLLTASGILKLCHLVLTSGYFSHYDGIYLQRDGVAMGNSLGPIAANLFMVNLERVAKQRALSSGLTFPPLWLRYVDDILVHWVDSDDALTAFLNFLNGLSTSIKFTMELEKGGSLPFLDVMISRKNERMSFKVHRKVTHTNRYIQRSSAHPIGVFKGLVRSLSGRIPRICSSENVQEEEANVYEALRANGYSDAECRRWWTLGSSSDRPADEDQLPFSGSLPYIPGISERIRGVLREVDVRIGMKPISTLHKGLVRKRPAPSKQLGVIYELPCGSSDCSWTYVGESGRTLEERKREHIKAVREFDVERSEVANHAASSGHSVNFDGMRILDRETVWKKRIIKEAWWTKQLSSSNRTKFPMSDFWTS